jgi:hypothetical protein
MNHEERRLTTCTAVAHSLVHDIELTYPAALSVLLWVIAERRVSSSTAVPVPEPV